MKGQKICITDWKMCVCLRTGAIIVPMGYNPPGHFHVDLFQCPTCKVVFTYVTTDECRDENCLKFLSSDYIFKEKGE